VLPEAAHDGARRTKSASAQAARGALCSAEAISADVQHKSAAAATATGAQRPPHARRIALECAACLLIRRDLNQTKKTARRRTRPRQVLWDVGTGCLAICTRFFAVSAGLWRGDPGQSASTLDSRFESLSWECAHDSKCQVSFAKDPPFEK